MIRNYWKITVRNLLKNKGFTAINIFGLAIGLATCLLILFYVTDELSFDRFNKNADRIYRIDGDLMFGGSHFIIAACPGTVGPTAKSELPEVEDFVRFRGYGGFVVRKGNQNLQENRVIYADSGLFKVFTLPMISGDPGSALKDPRSVVITENTANKYFGNTDVVGKNLIVDDTTLLKVTGVIENIPSNSHFNFDFFVSLSTSDESRVDNWLSNNFSTYLLLKKGADEKKVQEKLEKMILRYVEPQAIQAVHMNLEEFKKSGGFLNYSLMPLTDIHLYSNKSAELGVNGNIQYVYIFSLIALLILIIACVNFMNLSTARSSGRAKEVGVRKVLGSARKNLIGQFLFESILISFISLVLGLVLVSISIPYFNQLTGKQLDGSIFSNAWLTPALIVLMLIVGLLAGSYPAFFLSSFKPVEVLKGKLSAGFKSSFLRSGLVVFQFFISISLIIGTIVIYTQLKFIQNKDVGFDRQHVLVLNNTDPLGSRAKAFEQELLKIPGITNATMTGFLPTNGWRSDNPFFKEAVLNPQNAISMQVWSVDENYIPTLDMKIASGRNFSKDFPADSSGLIVNEAAAKLLGMQDPVNKKLYYLDDINGNGESLTPFHIVGVVKDFNFNSLRSVVTPVALMYKKQTSCMAFRINTKDIPSLIAAVERKWEQMAPGQPFSYSFMDDDFNRIYQSDQKVGKIFISFALFAILIACLGLFGLITYAAQQRTKEIGIRKVLGASELNVAGLLSKDFLKLIIIAFLVAFPIAWWAMNEWLQQFAYRITINWWMFLMAGLVAMLIGLITVSFQAIKAAIANPVDSLRSE